MLQRQALRDSLSRPTGSAAPATSTLSSPAQERCVQENANGSRSERCTHDSEVVISFSHFLPREELLLEKRFLAMPNALPKASGSAFLRQRVEDVRPDVHIFGHTHFAWDATIEEVRYIQAALAYPAERRTRWPSLAMGDFGAEPLLVWSSYTGFVPKMHCRWSTYYEHHAREPKRVFELAAYAARHYKKTDPRATSCMPDFSHEQNG